MDLEPLDGEQRRQYARQLRVIADALDPVMDIGDTPTDHPKVLALIRTKGVRRAQLNGYVPDELNLGARVAMYAHEKDYNKGDVMALAVHEYLEQRGY